MRFKGLVRYKGRDRNKEYKGFIRFLFYYRVEKLLDFSGELDFF